MGFAVELPPALRERGVTLRAERDADVAFLTALYASTRTAELALMAHWSDADRAAFVAQQFAAQRHHYRTAIEDVQFAVVERHGLPIGRLYVQPCRTAMRLIDITLHPDARGSGLGGALIGAAIGSAARHGLDVGLFVERYNPALSLYRRMGFAVVADHGVYLEMTRPRAADQLNTAS